MKPHPQNFPLTKANSLWSREDNELINRLMKLPVVVGGCYSNYEFGQGIDYIMDALRKVSMANIETLS